VEGKS